MPFQYINEMLNLPELNVNQILFVSHDELHLKAVPIDHKQGCPCCNSDEAVIRKGYNTLRMIRHLPVFEKKTYILVPSIRMYCFHCDIGFSWTYDFVGSKQRYSYLFRSRVVEQALGSTATHSARMQHAPISTVQAMHNHAVPVLSQQLIHQAWKDAHRAQELVLGIDDFAIKKGHTYNTGIHNLKGETMLDLLPGRKLEDLRAYVKNHPHFGTLHPKAVVMDLARAYHTWIRECFPLAIRIVDRFHVHGYVIESVQAIRKTVQQSLSPRAKAYLKTNHRLLNPPGETLDKESRKHLNIMLDYSSLLRQVWEWKEEFTVWYDYSPDYVVARQWFERWCEQGEAIKHPSVQSMLKTMQNWQEEIVNYHQCRWTNATVEGRHNRIKAYQRRHYFTRHYGRYKAGILVECNRHRMLD